MNLLKRIVQYLKRTENENSMFVQYRTSVSPWKQDQKQPSKCVIKKRCSENMQQIYRRTPMPKCDFNNVVSNFIEISLRHGCSPVNLLHIFSSPFPMNTSGRLLLQDASGTYMRHLEDTLDVFRRFNAF